MKRQRSSSGANVSVLSLALLAVVVAPAYATDVCGDIGTSTTWTAAGAPYVVTCDSTVLGGVTLTIDPGVEVRFQAAARLLVLGVLDVNGAPGNEVLFTSDSGTPAAGDWEALRFESAAVATLDYADIEYPVNGIYAIGTADITLNQVDLRDCTGDGLYVNSTGVVLDLDHVTITGVGDGVYDRGGSITLDDVEITGNGGYGVALFNVASASLTRVTSTSNQHGLYVYANCPSVTVVDSTFTGNSAYGVLIDGNVNRNPAVTIHDSSIHSNSGAYDLSAVDYQSPDTRVIDATGNWWGTTNESTIRSRIRDHATSGYSPMVDWCGYLDGPGGATARPGVYCPDVSVCGGTVAWTLTGQPYVLYTDTVVCSSGVLEIGPGVEVRAVHDDGVGIEVLGQLVVNGTTGNEVTFTSDRASPAPRDWQGLSFRGAGVGTIEYADVLYPMDAVIAEDTSSVTLSHVDLSEVFRNGVYVVGASADLSHVTMTRFSSGVNFNGGTLVMADVDITGGTSEGIYLYNVSSASLTRVNSSSNAAGLSVDGQCPSVSVTDSTFTSNTGTGVLIDGLGNRNPGVTIHDSSVHSNGARDLNVTRYANPDTTVVDATGNWWGTTNETTIRSRILDHADGAGRPLVDWCGYLDGPGGAPARPGVHCGDVSVCGGTVVWTATGQPYVLYTDTVVCPSGVLQIDPGVEVRAVRHDGVGLEVLGQLDVPGVAGNEVTFGSDHPSPAPGYWEGLRFEGAGTGAIDHASITWAVDGVFAENTASVALGHVAITECSTEGVRVHDSATMEMIDVTSSSNSHGVYGLGGGITITATGSRFTGNDQIGVFVDGENAGAPAVLFTNSSLHSNHGSWDLYAYRFLNAGSEILWAPDCWWGTTDHDVIRQRIYDQEDVATGPLVYFAPFGDDCVEVIGRDADGDGIGDFEDLCPVDADPGQPDADGDDMGDACDPEPALSPTGPCDGSADPAEGYADADGDGWGDPCDFQPTRADSYPGATELCDARNNDGTLGFVAGEHGDGDFDRTFTCDDCDDALPLVFPCGCEICDNVDDDDCDTYTDLADPDCYVHPSCVLVTAGSPEPDLHVMSKASCGAATASGPFDVIRGFVGRLQIVGSSIDLGDVECVQDNLAWDRVTDSSRSPNHRCDEHSWFFLAQDDGAAHFGIAGGYARDVMNPSPPCP